MSSSTKASSFLRAMNPEAEKPTNEAVPAPTPTKKADSKATAGRAGLKHIGGYFDRETVEMVAILRARLNLDNSALIKLAVEELHRKHEAKRAYGDANSTA